MKFLLEWEESVFVGLRSLWRKLSPQSESRWDAEHGVLLSPLIPRLTHLAGIIAGRPLLIREAENLGGARFSVLLLPGGMDLGQDREANINMFLLRTIINATVLQLFPHQPIHRSQVRNRVEWLYRIGVAIRHLEMEFANFSKSYRPMLARELEQRTFQNMITSDARLEELRHAIAGGSELRKPEALWKHYGLIDGPISTPGLVLWGEYLSPQDEELAATAMDEAELQSRPGDGTEIQAPPRDVVHRQQLGSPHEIEPLPVHTFEKVETLDTYKGGMRQMDGEDELGEHQEALDELDMRQVVRGGVETKGLYKADLDLNADIPDVCGAKPDGRAIFYPEWSWRDKAYKEKWVAVYASSPKPRDPGWGQDLIRQNRRTIKDLEKRLIVHRTRNMRCTRQPYGNEIDIDAMIEGYGLRKAGHPPSENVYEHQRRLLRDTATLVLMDISLSSGSWVENRRVLDVTRESVLILGEVSELLGDQLEVMCFASNTRNHCRIWTIKDIKERWIDGRSRLGLMEPQGYTRIGPALRHAAARMVKIRAKHKLLLLLTDGKPTDYDRYEGRYGREDVKMAVREAHKEGITIHALGLDPSARAALPSMFGVGGWELIRHLGELPRAMTRAYGRLTA